MSTLDLDTGVPVSSPLPACTALTAGEYAQLFLAGKPAPVNSGGQGAHALTELCGRFIRGKCAEHFKTLSDEQGKMLSWIMPGDSLLQLLDVQTSCAAKMMSIGMRSPWLRERLSDGTQHMLVVFPSSAGVVVTWENLWRLVKQSYGDEVDRKLHPFKRDIEQLQARIIATTKARAEQSLPPLANPYHEIDADGVIESVSNLPADVKVTKPNYVSAHHLLTLKTVTLYHARAFLEHSVGCNARFTGSGFGPDGTTVEMMTANVPLDSIRGLVKIPVVVTEADLCAAEEALKD
eukprot:m.206509 g.206509  ORF g.206509 m.206509 type:complete len:292 (+) comp32955_c1_seq8:237-1112(+)